MSPADTAPAPSGITYVCWAPEMSETEEKSGREIDVGRFDGPDDAAEKFAEEWCQDDGPTELVVCVRDGERVRTYEVGYEYTVNFYARERKEKARG